MHWLDVAGPPGSGKSTLCDLLWGPHELPIENRLPPAQWHDFLNEITRLFHLIEDHWSFWAAVRMNNRSIRKMATVARAAHTERSPYIQTGLVQRGLGFGWRLNDMGINLDELRHYFRLMPVSIGVAFTHCPADVVAQRNRDREKVAATAHENRAFMAPLMQPAIELAQEVIRERDIPVLAIDTRQPVERARERLVAFAGFHACDAAAFRSCCEVEVLSPPSWWLRSRS